MKSIDAAGDHAVIEWTPGADISERENEHLIRGELPGLKKADVRVTVEEGMITIAGESRMEKGDKTVKFHRVESIHGTFSSSFGLPENVDQKAILADSKDGVLFLHLPKAKLEKSKSVAIPINEERSNGRPSTNPASETFAYPL